jgi:hypothetical protein
MSGAISLSQSFWLENCTTCGIAFAMPQDFRDARLRDKKTFHCPNGHSLSYTQNEEDRLKSVLAGEGAGFGRAAKVARSGAATRERPARRGRR